MRRRPATAGLSLVEVVVALAVLGLALAAFGALQVTNLRASRRALEVRHATSLLAFEAGARPLLADASPDCRVGAWLPAGWTCAVVSTCDSPPGCAVRSIFVAVELPDGRRFTAAAAANAQLEAAPFRPAAPVPSTTPEAAAEAAQ